MMGMNAKTHALESSLLEALSQNEKETQQCLDYKDDLVMATRNLQTFQNKLRVDVMVPLGPHALMPGHLYHTNEVWIGKPTGLFIESSTNQALDIVQQRIKVADQQLKDLHVESEFFRNKLEYPQQKDVFSQEDQKEIIEEYNEDSEKQWRIAHRQRVKEAKLREREQRQALVPETDFHAVMENLEELELMEELQDEFNEIIASDPTDLSGQVEFKEKPRVSYELESYSRTEPVTSPPQVKVPTAIDDGANKSKVPAEPKKKAKRKSLQFSEDLEKVKLIHKMDRPNTLITTYDPELTLQLKFNHSPVEFRPPLGHGESKEAIRSPIDIYKQFAHCMKHAPSTPDDQPKSILKKTNYVIPVDRKAKLISADEEQPQFKDPQQMAGANIFQQVVGDVLERKATVIIKPLEIDSANVEQQQEQEPKRVSRFRASRS